MCKCEQSFKPAVVLLSFYVHILAEPRTALNEVSGTSLPSGSVLDLLGIMSVLAFLL